MKKFIIPVLKTIAAEKKGINELIEKIRWHKNIPEKSNKRINILVEKAYRLIQQKRMNDINKNELVEEIKKAYKKEDFNLYRFTENF
jgi:LAO/AO transport system kinase